MQAFTYKYGDQPLEGYTIQRAVGRGGFGEVYYALSDGGKEVALKVIQGFEQIELRGVGQCMNLKSPHLITVFDVKHNREGRPFVIMEYVAGPSLLELIQDAPGGMGTQKAAFFLREIAKGLTYLHERGIVHRDLKPGNIFYEDGYVKIGDYGLSKAITVSQHSAQTLTVGTVHYMAPEIGQGRYDRSIDIYALGVLLYEMLTGQVPFFGASHGEVLMKHLMDEPDLSGIDEPFKSVIRKALAKKPEDRYQSAQEMVEAVFGAEHIQHSVSHFSPESLSMVAGRVANKVVVGGPGSSGPTGETWKGQGGTGAISGSSLPGQEANADYLESRIEHVGRRLSHIGQRVADHLNSPPTFAGVMLAAQAGKYDAMSLMQRLTLWLITTIGISVGSSYILHHGVIDDAFWAILAFSFAVVAGASLSMMPAWYWFFPRLHEEKGFSQRLVFGTFSAIGAFVCGGAVSLAVQTQTRLRYDTDSFLAVVISLFLLNWGMRISPRREERVSLVRTFWAVVTGLCVSAFVCSHEWDIYLGASLLAGISLAVQALAPYVPKQVKIPGAPPMARGQQRIDAGRAHMARHAQHPPAGGGHGGHARRHTTPAPQQVAAMPRKPMPMWVRGVALIVFVIALGAGLCFVLYGFLEPEKAAILFGIGTMFASLMPLRVCIKRDMLHWWPDVIGPGIRYVLLQMLLVSLILLLDAVSRNNGDALIFSIFLTVFCGLFYLLTFFIPTRAIDRTYRHSRDYVNQQRSTHGLASTPSDKKRLYALLLTLPLFVVPFPGAGFHRFYTGKIATGVIWMLTGGLLYIGQIVDMILIIAGSFRDKEGRLLLAWQDMNELKDKPVPPPPPPVHQGRAPAEESASRHVGQKDEPVAQPAVVDAPMPADAGDESLPAAEPVATGAAKSRLTPGGILLWMVGSMLLTLGWLAGLLVAIDLPRMIVSGVFGEDVNYATYELFGYEGWPSLMLRIGSMISIGGLLAAGAFLLLARRRTGDAWYMGRVVLGISGIWLSFMPLDNGFTHMEWVHFAALLADDKIGPAVEMILEVIQGDPLIAVAIYLVSMTVLLWPDGRRKQLSTDSRGVQ